jgi:hypothetical protein
MKKKTAPDLDVSTLDALVNAFLRDLGSRDAWMMNFPKRNRLPREHEERLRDLRVWLRSQPTLQDYDGAYRPLGRQWSSLSIDGLSCELVFRAWRNPAWSPGAWLRTYLAADSIWGRSTLYLGGVTLGQPLSLGNGIVLAPVKRGDHLAIPFNPGEEYSVDAGRKITAQIFREWVHPRLHFRTHKPPSRPYRTDIDDFAELYDVTHCVTLARTVGVAVLASSVAPVTRIPEFRDRVGQPPRYAHLQSTLLLSENDLHVIRELHAALEEREHRERELIRRGASRLSSALRRADEFDMAVDLGVALEVIFLSGNVYDGSIGFRLRVLASRLLRQERGERQIVEEQIKSLYQLRSSAAHSGHVSASGREVLESGTVLAGEALRYVVRNGLPDWDTVLFG